MNTLGNSKTIIVDINESGDYSFYLRFNINTTGGTKDGRYEGDIPPGLLVALKNFIDGTVVPSVKTINKLN